MEKETLIKYLHLIEDFKKKDPKMLDYTTKMEVLSKETASLYAHKEDPEAQERLNETTVKHDNLKKEKEAYLKEKFKTFMEQCPKSIINMVLEDAVNFELLEHVLTQVKDYKQGNITYNDGLNNGLEFIRKVNNLPDDFFVKQ
jgi:hypothetical protein